MNDQQPQPNLPPLGEQPLGDLTPLSIIRTETVLSRLPIHNLAKKGNINIQITRKNAVGEVELGWEVSYNARYGQPRQLAYKLDTVIINRRIDEEGRPLPRMIKLGSLNELCQDLGSQKDELKRAIHQNATTAVKAKLSYRANDGAERHLEALFTRYSVVFTGEKLPDGRRADAVYIVLNEPYREVLNNAPVRPLNYDYLRQLPPAAERFYEIISFRIFAALKTGHSLVRLPYSDYCTFSAQQRYFDYDHFKKQMYKVHRLHLSSGYIAKVQYEETRDAEGRVDWMMCYTPGPKARTEYAAFTRRPKLVAPKPLEQAAREQETATQARPAARKQAPQGQPSQPTLSNPLLVELTHRGITQKRATKLLQSLAAGQQLLDQLEWGDYLIQSQPGLFRNPPGFLISLIEHNVVVPESFETSRRRKLREEAQRAQDEQLRLEVAYEDYKRREIDRYIQKSVTEYELHRLTEVKKKEILERFKDLALLAPETLSSLLRGAVRAEIARRVPFLTFQAYCEEQRRQPSLFPDPTGQGSGLPAQDEAALHRRYEAYCRQQAQAALDALGRSERGRRLRAARLHLLNEHPDRARFQQLIAEEKFDEFQKVSEDRLMEETMLALNLPSFEQWRADQPPTLAV